MDLPFAEGLSVKFDEVLTAQGGLEALPALAAALGYQAVWEEIPLATWLRDAEAYGVRRGAMVGRGPGFIWFGVECDEPARSAPAVARRLLGRGEPAGVLAVASQGRRLAVSVAYGGVPSLELAMDRPSPLAAACLQLLRARHASTGFAQAAAVAEILAGEAAGRRFFEGFRSILRQVSEAFEGSLNPLERHSLALLQLTRILFLYFVQAKGWLNGEPDFLRRQVDECVARGGSISRDLLRPLFFGMLNRRIGSRGRAERFGRIPFLNGGLFEPHWLERRSAGALPNAVWLLAFDDLFERFRFTICEPGAEAAAGQVAPDMLGRVFEGVMSPEVRRSSGTFFTPAPLVRELVEAGLTAWLASRLGLSDAGAAERLRDRSPAVRHFLREVTVLDPAVGSGGFLLGALERLAELRDGEVIPLSALKREILRRNLFGVDLNPMAVRLAELRLWLAVIADDPEELPEHVLPLPNLDCLIRQGDALSDPLGLVTNLALRPIRAGRLAAAIRQRFVLASGEEKRAAAKVLRTVERQAARECLAQAAQRVELDLAECLEAARAPNLFGGPARLTKPLRQRLRVLRAARRQMREARRRLEREGELPWFQFERHFPDVFGSRGGFDLIVGNPPWVRGERLPPAVRDHLARRYAWWRGGRGGSGFGHRPDLAVAFLERSFELAAPGGAIAMLLPAKLASAGYGTVARRALGAYSALHAVVDLTDDPGARFEATTYPLALVLSKRPPPANRMVRESLPATDPASIPQAALLDGAPWITRPGLSEVVRSLEGRHPTIGSRYAVQLGVKTGANRAFLNPQGPVELALLRFAIRGREIRPFGVKLGTRIIWTHDELGRPYERLPPMARRHFQTFEALLRSRADYVGGPPWMVFRTAGLLAPGRVVWADLARSLNALALTGDPRTDPIPLNTCYLLPTRTREEALSLTAWLNATWIRRLAWARAVPARGGYARFTARTVEALPLPARALADSALQGLARSAAAGHSIQEELDERCASHLALSAAERSALVGPPTGDPKADGG
jgi:hypothetical protein